MSSESCFLPQKEVFKPIPISFATYTPKEPQFVVDPNFKLSIDTSSFAVASSISNPTLEPVSGNVCNDNVFTPSEVALIDLLKMLEGHKCDLILFDKILEWIKRSTHSQNVD